MKKTFRKITMVFALIALTGALFAAVSEKEAVDIALSDAEVSRDSVSAIRSHRDWDDGRDYYEVEFRTDEGKWEYEIDIESGRIVGYDFDKAIEKRAFEDGIDNKEAEDIALYEAGLGRDEVSRLRSERDRDDGMIIYEVKFNTSDSEYEYDINGEDGRILSASWEKRGRVSGDRNATLTIEEAEAIALDYLGPDAENLSVWEDRDDGRFWYEAHAKVGDYLYEMDIAGSGEVHSITRELRSWR